MNRQIRPFAATLTEYNAIAAIHNAAWQATGPSGENRQRHDAGRNADFFFQRLLAEIDGQIVAYAAYGEDAWNHTPGKYAIEIAVQPSYQRRGLARALLLTGLQVFKERGMTEVVLGTSSRKAQCRRRRRRSAIA